MRSNIIQIQEIDQYSKFLGKKTLNLKKCTDWGFNVPKFVALPSYTISELFQNETFRKETIQKAIEILGIKKYAVRSSALIEDNQNDSFAGQFCTKGNVSFPDLSKNIYEVIKQAEHFLKGDLNNFSIVIQEYVAPDTSGVTFTRNPNGDREMIIEYGFCEGEKIVSGKIKPAKISLYWNDQNKKLPKFLTRELIENFREIENKYSFPQDIEWCIKDGQFYLLQTRPITTISKNQYEQIIFLEKFLSKNEKYYFEKTEISETAPRPSILTYDLLNFIYSKNGPVAKVYKKYGVNYKNTNFLKVIGNELFVDKEKEIQGLLPSYSYLRSKNLAPKFHKLLEFLPTVKNLFFLNKIKTNKQGIILNNLKNKMESGNPSLDIKISLRNFLTDYELIFEANLLSGLSIKKLNYLLKNDPINFPEIVSGYSYFVDLTKIKMPRPAGLKGNSLELTDESDFIANENIENKPSSKLASWWQNLPEYRKKMMSNAIAEAIIYNRLREFGRWLTIKSINALKNSLLNCAERAGFENAKNIYFANFANVLNNKLAESSCIKNKNFYDLYNHFTLPNSITSILIFKKSKTFGVSSGLANGILQSQAVINVEIDENRKYILYTEILSPDLTKYFDKISGIVSNNGGLLSHLAIMAREKNIPVIIGFSIKDSKFKLGDYVQIDGSNGKIVKVNL